VDVGVLHVDVIGEEEVGHLFLGIESLNVQEGQSDRPSRRDTEHGNGHGHRRLGRRRRRAIASSREDLVGGKVCKRHSVHVCMWALDGLRESFSLAKCIRCTQLQPSSRGSTKVLGSRTRTGRRVETMEGTGLGQTARGVCFEVGSLGAREYGNSNNWLFSRRMKLR